MNAWGLKQQSERWSWVLSWSNCQAGQV